VNVVEEGQKEQVEVSLYFTSPSRGGGEVRVYYVSSPLVTFFVATMKRGNFQEAWGVDSFSPLAALNQAAMAWEKSRPVAQGNPFRGALSQLLDELEGEPPQLIPLL